MINFDDLASTEACDTVEASNKKIPAYIRCSEEEIERLSKIFTESFLDINKYGILIPAINAIIKSENMNHEICYESYKKLYELEGIVAKKLQIAVHCEKMISFIKSLIEDKKLK